MMKYLRLLPLYTIYHSLLTLKLALCYPVPSSSPGRGNNPPSIKSVSSTNIHETSFTLNLDRGQRQDIGIQDDDNDNTIVRESLTFDYELNELIMNLDHTKTDDDISTSFTTATTSTIVLLIHPIGVGISRWYYDRLLQELPNSHNKIFLENENSDHEMHNLIFLAPDLLGCGTACNPQLVDDSNDKEEVVVQSIINKLPLFKVNDWADQLLDLMTQYEFKLKQKDDNNTSNNHEINWCVVSNGGCVPIALEIGAKSKSSSTTITSPITNLILSATPSANSLFNEQNWNKVQRSYNILSGIPGSIFWWYALRNNGQFIKSFSIQNLAAKEENLGEDWTSTCVNTAKKFNGQSRFSTFAFLAGSLNGGNSGRIDLLKGRNIDVITGSDTRRNRARSWFWDKNNSRKRKQGDNDDEIVVKETTLVPILRQNDNGGREFFVGGRRCPAHEDAPGFAKVLLQIITE